MAKTIRNEVLAFILAAQDLMTREAKEPLSDEEAETVAGRLAKLKLAFLDAHPGRITERFLDRMATVIQRTETAIRESDPYPF